MRTLGPVLLASALALLVAPGASAGLLNSPEYIDGCRNPLYDPVKAVQALVDFIMQCIRGPCAEGPVAGPARPPGAASLTLLA